MEEAYSCKNCGTTIQENFCGHCGQKVIKERWTLKKLSKSMVNALFNLERGYFYTFISMAKNPGEVVQNYLNGNTIKYTNPFRYALISMAVSIFIILSLGIWELQVDQIIESYKDFGIINSESDETNARRNIGIVTKFMNIMPFLLLPGISLSSLLFLEKRKLYYAEHFILNTFMLGQSILYGIVFSILVYLFPTLINFQIIIGFLIAAMVYSQIFKDLFKIGYLKGAVLGFLTYLIGFIFFLIMSIIIAIIIGIVGALFFGLKPQ